MHGWMGKILHIDLTDGTVRVETAEPHRLCTWIGGRGLAGALLQPAATRSWDDPAAPLLLVSGPLVGTAAPTSGRMTFMARSPLTGTIGDSSVGGRFGTSLKKAGYDGVVITGRHETLCGLEIHDDQVKIVPAAALAGVPSGTIADRLEGKGAVATTGPAADHAVRFACIMVDRHHAAGRNGLGAVMGAKNLKYITVEGTGRVAVHDPEALKRAREDVFRLVAASPVLSGEHGLAHYGTGALYDLMAARRMMPTLNFRETVFDGAAAMNAHHYRERYQPKRAGCQGCHILCKKKTATGRMIPEFETMSHFSALVGNRDLDAVMDANHQCGELGIDTISAAVTLACHGELTGERLTPERIGELLDAIGHGRGVGAELGQGSYRYAAEHGRPELSMSVKGQELPAYDPRGAYGMALAYAMSTRGGCHLRAYPISHEILRKPVATDRFTFSGKARIIKIAEDANAVIDSLTACKFVFFGSSLEEYAKVYTAVTGQPSSAQDLLTVGERIAYQERILNGANGFTAADDDLPPRFFEEAGSSGNNISVPPLDRDAFLAARQNYYQVRGLTAEGLPTADEAERLGVPWMPWSASTRQSS